VRPAAALVAVATAFATAVVAVAALGAEQASYTGATIVGVDFDADEPVDARSLRELVPLVPGHPLREEDLEEARRLLAWKDVWSEISTEVIPDQGGVRVVFHLVIKRTVSSMSVSGYHTFYAEDLVRRVRISSGAALTSESVGEARERLREYYRREGFADTTVTVLETPQAHRQVALDFQIEEGEPFVVACIVLEGEIGFPSEDLARALKVDAGARRTKVLEREVKRRALLFYRDRNHFDASVSVSWRPEENPKRGALVVNATPGVLFVIRFIGNEALSRSKLLDLIDLSKRPVITEATWREIARRITSEYRASGYYKAIVKLDSHAEGENRVIEYRIEEGERYQIHRIEFVGNDAIPAATLEGAMETRLPSWVPFSSAGTLDDDVLNDDLRRIWFLYRRQGFESAEVVDVRTTFDGAAIDLFIEIDEGPRSIVTNVNLVGFEDVTPLPTLTTRVGQPFNPDDRDADVKALVVAVSRGGYPDAKVEAEVGSVRAPSSVETTVKYRAEPGPHRDIGPVVVQGNLITKDRVVLRELPFQEGGPYDPQALIDGQTNVYRLGLFRRVSVRPLESAGDKKARPVAVSVDERPAGTFSYGFGYESDIGFRTFGEAAYDNLQGMDRRLSLRGDFSILPSDAQQTQYLLNLGFRTPHVFDTNWVSRSNAILVRNTLTLNRFSIEGFTLATALEREIVPRFIVGGLIEMDQGDTFDVASDANLAPEGVKDVGFLRQVDFGPFLEFDRRDDPFAPRSGTLDTFRLRYAEPGIGSDIRFLSMTGKHVQYIPLTENLTFVYALRGSWALAMDGEFTVPIRDRYFLGGRTTVRGFEENSIAPLGANGDPIGGDIALNGNLELRFPLFFGFGGAIFFDTGGSFLRKECTDTTCNFSELSYDNFRRSAGIGLRYLTPVGPMSFEYGFKIDRRTGESIGAFHFTIGNIF